MRRAVRCSFSRRTSPCTIRSSSRSSSTKGLAKFVAFEVPVSLARQRYGGHFQAVESGLHETDVLRVLDFNGQRVFQLFRFDGLGAPILQEQP